MMNLQKHNNTIKQSLNEIEKNYKELTKKTNPWAKIAGDLLFAFSKKGKMVRGNLLLESVAILSNGKNTNAALLAAALELIHSGLLIHDDIMDQDALRRGSPTIHKQLESLSSNSKPTAEALAICIGDISFFVALHAAGAYNSSVVQKLTNEITLVGLGQMQDVCALGDINTQSILKTYIYKTGRYTFSLPFALAGLLSKSSEPEIQSLEKIGESIGILFQIHDDYLGLFGNSSTTGKQAVSDIQKDKLTLYKLFLLESKNKHIKTTILPLFGKQSITAENVQQIQNVLTDYKITEKVDQIKQELVLQTKEEIKKLENTDMQKFLTQILEFVTTRST